jgi:hypothetical protein
VPVLATLSSCNLHSTSCSCRARSGMSHCALRTTGCESTSSLEEFMLAGVAIPDQTVVRDPKGSDVASMSVQSLTFQVDKTSSDLFVDNCSGGVHRWDSLPPRVKANAIRSTMDRASEGSSKSYRREVPNRSASHHQSRILVAHKDSPNVRPLAILF